MVFGDGGSRISNDHAPATFTTLQHIASNSSGQHHVNFRPILWLPEPPMRRVRASKRHPNPKAERGIHRPYVRIAMPDSGLGVTLQDPKNYASTKYARAKAPHRAASGA
jgi:hypothetical protein